jgi:1-phosphofructokinase
MIYTVTLNPSLDYIVTVDDFKLGYTNRTSSELMLPGGKGTNVSIVLKNLGISSTALGFVAGFTGDEIVRELEETGIHTDFVKMKEGISRINLKLSSIDGTEINGQGPDIPKEQLDMLMERLMVLKEGDILVLAGSIPATMPPDIYEQIMEKLYDRKVTIIVDATKDLLLNVLKYHPFLIKPNHHELGEIFNVELSEWDDVVPYAKKLQEMGAVNVLVSMGEKGGVLVSDDGRVIATKATATVVKNSVGAGDSSVAGFIAGWLEKKNYDYAFSMAMATGGASAASEYLATKPEVEASLKRVDLKYLV